MTLGRGATALLRTTAAMLLAGVAASAWSEPHAHDLPPRAAELLKRAETALTSGHGDAVGLFEQAAAYAHVPEIEAGGVRALMQEGRYREALAFAAHVAGAHPNEPLGTALYAWLLHIGGQTGQALQRIEAARRRWPDDSDIEALHGRMARSLPITAAAPTIESRALAPLPRGGAEPPLANHAHVLTTAVRVAPDLALAAWPTQPAIDPLPGMLWIRDALGRTRAVTVLHREPALGLAVLWWRHPLGGPVPVAVRDGFPGSPAYAAGYASTPDASPQWPRMVLGFIGMPADQPVRWLDVDLPDSDAGGPVFDAAGRLQGITLPTQGQRARYLPLSSWRALAGLSPADPAQEQAAQRQTARSAPDEVYEQALSMTLQVLAGTPR